MKLCLDLSRCYYRHLGRLGWAVCLRLLVVLFKAFQKLKPQKSVVNLSEICKLGALTSNFKKCSLARLIKTQVCLLGLLVVLLLLWGCSTLQSSRYSAPSTLTQPSLPSHHQKVKKPQVSSGDLSNFQVEQKSPLRSLRGTSLWSQSPLWGQSLDFISHQEDEKAKNAH